MLQTNRESQFQGLLLQDQAGDFVDTKKMVILKYATPHTVIIILLRTHLRGKTEILFKAGSQNNTIFAKA